jgi:hypothetical protein
MLPQTGVHLSWARKATILGTTRRKQGKQIIRNASLSLI